MNDLMMRRDRRQQNPVHDPLVWCDCFRDTLLLSLKVAGVGCVECRRDAGDVFLAPAERTALESRLRELEAKREDAEGEADRLRDELAEVEERAYEADREAKEIRAQLARDR